MNHDHDDDPDLAVLSALYRQAETPEPPPALDVRILAAARRETVKKPRWLTPLALAASLVLAVSLVTVLRQEQTARDSAPAPAASKAAASLEERQSVAESAAPADSARSLAPAAPPAAPMVAAEPAVQLQATVPVPTPAEWLAEIGRLREQGQRQAAEQSLREFRQQYPDYPLPPDLTP